MIKPVAASIHGVVSSNALQPPVPQIDPGVSTRLSAIFEAHHTAAWRLLRRLGLTPSEADDAAQEVFVVLGRKLHQVQPGAERAFVLSTAQRIAAGVRRRRPAVEPVERLEGVANEPPSTDAELTAWLDTALASLDDDVREVVVLCELERCTRDEAAQLLDLPAGTVASRLRRGLAHLEAAASRFTAQVEREQHGRLS